MEVLKMVPIVVYDDQCYLCMKFAKAVNFLSRGKLTMIGHYSELGKQIRDEILDESALDMFWFIDKKRACGGRAALIPLAKEILFGQKKRKSTTTFQDNCSQDCKTVKAVFVRSSSLITNSKKIDL